MIDGGNRDEVHVVDGKLFVAVHKINAAAARAVNGGNVQLHHLRMGGHFPGTALAGIGVGGTRVAHPQGDGRNAGRVRSMRGALRIHWVGVHHDIEPALAVQQHLAGAVACHRFEAHHLQHLAQGLRLGSGVFDELHAVQAQRVGRVTERCLQRLAIAGRVGYQIAHGLVFR